MRRNPSWHSAAALAAFTLLAVVHTWPLAAHLATHLPGDHLGDNAVFAWNVWWMREALSQGHSFFQTDALFAPEGVGLVLHTHTALGAAIVAPLALDPVTATNLLVIACIALNGFAAYVLANEVTGSRPAALLAGVLFLGAPPLTLRLMGHFNLLYAWTMVFAIVFVIRARRRPSAWRAATAGAVVGSVAWADYYLFVYTLLALGVVALARAPWRVDWQRRHATAVGKTILAGLGIVLLVAVVVAMTGGFVVRIFGTQLSMRSTTNLFTFAWLLIIAYVVMSWRPAVSWTSGYAVDRRTVSWALAAGGLVLVPLAWAAIDLMWRGDYLAPPRFWRSAPPGADVLTFVLGPPHHWLVGPAVRDAYRSMRIDLMEMSGWLGLIGPVLAATAIVRFRGEAAVRLAAIVALVFLVWSLGAFLYIAGTNTGIVLPQQLVRFVPVLANARMPARALIVVSLAVALLAARWAREQPKRVVWGIAVFVFIEQLAAPLALAAIPRRGLDARVAALPDGVVLNLPFGYRDGFGSHGAQDPLAMLGQTVHRKPIVGGFVARLSPRAQERYERNATLAGAARVSAGERVPPPTCADGLRDLHALRVRYIVAHDVFRPWLESFPLRVRDAEAEWTIYEVDARCP